MIDEIMRDCGFAQWCMQMENAIAEIERVAHLTILINSLHMRKTAA